MKDEVTLRVEPNCEMPRINVPMTVSSMLSDTKYIFIPKRIKGVRWHPDGAVIIDLSGDKQKWKNSEPTVEEG